MGSCSRPPGPGEDLGLSLGDRAAALLSALGSARSGGQAIAFASSATAASACRRPGPTRAPVLNAIGTAFVDEAAFRGAVLGFLLLVGFDPVTAIVIQALVYALATRLGAPGRDRYMFVLALVMGSSAGWLTSRPVAIGAAFLGHAITRFAMFVCTGHAGQPAPRGPRGRGDLEVPPAARRAGASGPPDDGEGASGDAAGSDRTGPARRRRCHRRRTLAAGAAGGPPPPPVALYVHVPFCVSLCPYCDFVV